MLGIVQGAVPAQCVINPAAKRRELAVAAWLTFSTLGPERRAQLIDTLEAAADSLDARLHPLAIDFAEESPEQSLQRIAPWLLRVWTAARALSRSCYTSGDGALTVLVPSPQVPLDPGATLFDPQQPSMSDATRLGRFLAWPHARSLLVRAQAPAARVWAALRLKVGDPAEPLGVVIDSFAQAVQPRDKAAASALSRLTALRKRLLHFQTRTKGTSQGLGSHWLALVGEMPTPPALPWLALDADQALVIPTLSSDTQNAGLLRTLRAAGATPSQ